LILAGISVTLCEARVVTLAALASNFFLREEDVGSNIGLASVERVRELNPFATASTVEEVTEATIEDHSLVIVERTGAESDALFYENLEDIARWCREKNKAFFYARSDCDAAFFLSDFGDTFKYRGDGPKKDLLETAYFPAFGDFFPKERTNWNFAKKKQAAPLAVWLDWIDRSFVFEEKEKDYVAFGQKIFKEKGLRVEVSALERHRHVAGASLGFLNAILAGVLGQECIKFIARQGEPLNNLFLFDSNTDAGTVYSTAESSQPPQQKVLADLIDIDQYDAIEIED